VASYPITELFGEKLRALAERCGPRDLYDVVHLHRHPDLMGRANRLRVEIDYRPEQGRSGPRVVEPYALRRTSEGNIVLFVINDRRQLRSYRIDRIAGIKPTAQTFTAVRRVEF
jgi:hypothetical protein